MPLNDRGNVLATNPKAKATASMSNPNMFCCKKFLKSALFHILRHKAPAANIQNNLVPISNLTPLIRLDNSPGLLASLTKLPGAKTRIAVPVQSDIAMSHVRPRVFL